MQKHQQLVSSLGATVVMADSESDFMIAEHDDTDDSHLEVAEAANPKPKAEEKQGFGSAVKTLLTSTTCHKY